MTPREMAAWLDAGRTVERFERAQSLWLNTLAARGDPKEVKKQLKELQKDS